MKDYCVLKTDLGVALPKMQIRSCFAKNANKFEILPLVIFCIISKLPLFLFWNPNFTKISIKKKKNHHVEEELLQSSSSTMWFFFNSNINP